MYEVFHFTKSWIQVKNIKIEKTDFDSSVLNFKNMRNIFNVLNNIFLSYLEFGSSAIFIHHFKLQVL